MWTDARSVRQGSVLRLNYLQRRLGGRVRFVGGLTRRLIRLATNARRGSEVAVVWSTAQEIACERHV
jgi:hypothetical protein